MATDIFAKSITTYDQFREAVSRTGHALTQKEVERASKRFAVPESDVLGLREEVLKKSNAASDEVGQQSKALRDQTSTGRPIGGATVQGLGGPMTARAEAIEEAGPKAVPSYVDVDSTFVYWGVPLRGRDQTTLATAMLEDSKKNQVRVQIPVKGDDRGGTPLRPRISFQDASIPVADEILLLPIAPELAKSLLPLLDAALANSPRPDVHGNDAAYGSAVVDRVREHVQNMLVGMGAPTRPEDQATFDKAAATFDKGNFAQGERILGELARGSVFPDLRARASFVLGEMHYRQGRNEEAHASIKLALVGLGAGGRVLGLEMLAKIENRRRDFEAGKALAGRAVEEGNAIIQSGGKIDLTSAHFTLGVAQKNLGEIDDAIASMKSALASKPGAAFIQLALAGYLGIAGKKDEAAAMFASIPVPPKTEMAFIDYNTNATWFHAVNRDRDQVLQFAEQALIAAKGFNFPGTVNYFKSETDLDWMRGDADFQKLIAHFGG